MAKFPISTTFVSLTFLISHLSLIIADTNLSFSFQSFGKDQNFESNIALYGDAKVVDNGSSVQLTHSVNSSGGRVMYRRPIQLVEGNPGKMVSLSTYFSFFMSQGIGDGLAFIMVPSAFNANAFGNGAFGVSLDTKKNYSKIVAVEFRTLKDTIRGDLYENQVGIHVDAFVSAKVRNVSSTKATFDNWTRLHSWIDYEASAKRLEVRMSQSGDIKPIDPLLWYPVDLSRMWNEEEVIVGLSSSNAVCALYSWNFKLRSVPHWLHSQPLNPQTFAKNEKSVVAHKRSYCLLRVLAAMIFGTTCGALGAFILLYLCSIFGNRRPVVPEDCSVHLEDLGYKKVKVVVDKVVEDGKP
ncbi:hypothetical protein K2173_019661 [Erythroxylum novogranatense]|uniref:Legume lectin domain-containing protein n=1 Tax=Erythroxylum novogranatense TaxID=1862640 RepID=A0AAV8UEN9_9ROSI|nr:hypothetical protein K2173_019661 [Erythroxylum novogranatense]